MVDLILTGCVVCYGVQVGENTNPRSQIIYEAVVSLEKSGNFRSRISWLLASALLLLVLIPYRISFHIATRTYSLTDSSSILPSSNIQRELHDPWTFIRRCSSSYHRTNPDTNFHFWEKEMDLMVEGAVSFNRLRAASTTPLLSLTFHRTSCVVWFIDISN